MCHFDNLPTCGTEQHGLTIHDLINIGIDKCDTHRPVPYFQKTICECGGYSLPSDVTAGFQPLLTWTLSICALILQPNIGSAVMHMPCCVEEWLCR